MVQMTRHQELLHVATDSQEAQVLLGQHARLTLSAPAQAVLPWIRCHNFLGRRRSEGSWASANYVGPHVGQDLLGTGPENVRSAAYLRTPEKKDHVH